MTIKDTNNSFVCCPDCNSRNVRYSNEVQIRDFFMWLRRKHALRCRSCRSRFYAPTNEAANSVWVMR